MEFCCLPSSELGFPRVRLRSPLLREPWDEADSDGKLLGLMEEGTSLTKANGIGVVFARCYMCSSVSLRTSASISFRFLSASRCASERVSSRALRSLRTSLSKV